MLIVYYVKLVSTSFGLPEVRTRTKRTDSHCILKINIAEACRHYFDAAMYAYAAAVVSVIYVTQNSVGDTRVLPIF